MISRRAFNTSIFITTAVVLFWATRQFIESLLPKINIDLGNRKYWIQEFNKLNLSEVLKKNEEYKNIQNANKKLKSNTEKTIYTIAVVVDDNSIIINGEEQLTSDKTRQILQGIYEGQKKINESPNKKYGIKVKVINEGNDLITREKNAKILINNPDIVAVIGYTGSKAVNKIKELYNKYQLVLLLPTATNDNLVEDKGYVFRMPPNDTKLVTEIKNFITNNQTTSTSQKIKLMIFRSSDKESYSYEISESFCKIDGNQLSCEEQFDKKINDLNTHWNSVETDVNSAIRAQVPVVIFPDSEPSDTTNNECPNQTNLSECNAVLSIRKINSSDQKPLVFTGDSFYNFIHRKDELIPKNFQPSSTLTTVNFILPWYYQSNDNQPPTSEKQDFVNLWNGKGVGWRAAMSYDSVLALDYALQNLKVNNFFCNFKNCIGDKRRQIRKNLSSMTNVKGATGTLQFDETGERESYNSIAVVQLEPNGNEYKVKVLPNEY